MKLTNLASSKLHTVTVDCGGLPARQRDGVVSAAIVGCGGPIIDIYIRSAAWYAAPPVRPLRRSPSNILPSESVGEHCDDNCVS